MARPIANVKKLARIVEQHSKHTSLDPFVFTMDESLRIRQLIGESLVIFFAKLNGLPVPGPQGIPKGMPGTEKRAKKRRWKYR